MARDTTSHATDSTSLTIFIHQKKQTKREITVILRQQLLAKPLTTTTPYTKDALRSHARSAPPPPPPLPPPPPPPSPSPPPPMNQYGSPCRHKTSLRTSSPYQRPHRLSSLTSTFALNPNFPPPQTLSTTTRTLPLCSAVSIPPEPIRQLSPPQDIPRPLSPFRRLHCPSSLKLTFAINLTSSQPQMLSTTTQTLPLCSAAAASPEPV